MFVEALPKRVLIGYAKISTETNTSEANGHRFRNFMSVCVETPSEAFYQSGRAVPLKLLILSWFLNMSIIGYGSGWGKYLRRSPGATRGDEKSGVFLNLLL